MMHKNGKHSASEAPNDMMGQHTAIGRMDIESASKSFKAESDGSLGGKTSTKLNTRQGQATRATIKQHSDKD